MASHERCNATSFSPTRPSQDCAPSSTRVSPSTHYSKSAMPFPAGRKCYRRTPSWHFTAPTTYVFFCVPRAAGRRIIHQLTLHRTTPDTLPGSTRFRCLVQCPFQPAHHQPSHVQVLRTDTVCIGNESRRSASVSGARLHG